LFECRLKPASPNERLFTSSRRGLRGRILRQRALEFRQASRRRRRALPVRAPAFRLRARMLPEQRVPVRMLLTPQAREFQPRSPLERVLRQVSPRRLPQALRGRRGQRTVRRVLRRHRREPEPVRVFQPQALPARERVFQPWAREREPEPVFQPRARGRGRAEVAVRALCCRRLRGKAQSMRQGKTFFSFGIPRKITVNLACKP
jgi:hypothetical protein